jgi:hypothetical protein
MMDLNAVLETLKKRMEVKTTAIQDLKDDIELKQMEIRETEDMLALLESLTSQLLEDRDALLDSYNDLLNKARKRKVMSFMPAGINEFRARTSDIDIEQTEEKARKIIEKEEAILRSYDLSEKVNRLRYKIRKTDTEEQEYMDSLNELSRINELLDKLDNE